MLSQFLDSGRYIAASGRWISFEQFVADFHTFLHTQALNAAEWPAKRIRRELETAGYPVGAGPQSALCIGNLLDPKGKRKFVKVGTRRMVLVAA